MFIKRIISIVVLFLLTIVNVALGKNIDAHQDKNGTTKYSYEQYSSGFAGRTILDFNKIIHVDQTYYYIYVYSAAALHSPKKMNMDPQIVIDEAGIFNLKKIKIEGNFFLIPQECIEAIQKAKTLKLVFSLDDKKTYQMDIKPETLEAISKIINLEKKDFIRNGPIVATDPKNKNYPEMREPQIYIPNINPEQLIDPLIHYTNHKEYRPFYGLFCYTAFGKNKNVIQFAERYGYNGGHLAFHVLLEPHAGGTLITTDVGKLEYVETQGYYFVKAKNKSTNRFSVDQFQKILNLLMEQAYGVYDYGIIVKKKDETGNSFEITSLTNEQFNGTQGAQLIAIDGIAAKDLFVEDIEQMTKYGNGNARTFTLQTTEGEKTFIITPRLDISKKKPLDSLKPNIYKGLSYKGGEPRSTIFDPLAAEKSNREVAE